VKLPANKREANAEFEQKFLDMVEQTLFEVALMCVAVEREKIKVVWIFERLFGEIGLWRWQCALESWLQLCLRACAVAFQCGA
jgi:hypothetical protein